MPQEFFRFICRFSALAGVVVLAGCGGGGGNGGNPDQPTNPAAPTVSLSVNPSSITAGQSVAVTWSSANATSCLASGGWSGTKATSGTETSAALSGTTTFTLTCSGTGGSSSASATATLIGPPAVTLSADPTAVTVNFSTTLTWSATNATSCTASDGWTGTKAASGSESSPPLTAATTTFTLTCTGAGGSGSQQVTVTASPPPAGMIVLSGEVTFDRLPFGTSGLNGSAPVKSPARQVVVELMSGVTTTASTTTDTNGHYAFIVPQAVNVAVRARAQMRRTGGAPTWNFRVLNNTGGDAEYILNGSTFNTGTSNVAVDLHAASGWNDSSSTYSGPRNAAPFAILDTVYNTKQLILSAAPTATLPDLNLYWSTQNRTTSEGTPFCTDNGNIGTSFYFSDPSGQAEDDCSDPLDSGIYILGDYGSGAGDTDEFDAHVIAHEFGHYFEDQFSRADSIGGEHSTDDRLDLRVAFGEGWGNAFGAMSLNNPQYRDSYNGISQDFGFDLETGTMANEGWFSEMSVGEVLWDIFDTTTTEGSNDTVALGFQPIYAVLTNEQKNTDAFTSIFSFAEALQSNNAGAASSIEALLDREDIEGNDRFGAGEDNNGSDTQALPVYRDITLNAPLNGVCTNSLAGATDLNKLGNRRFLRFVNSASRLVTITASGAVSGLLTEAAVDPDILVYRQGGLVAVGGSDDLNQESINQVQLAAGTYVIEVYDFELTDGSKPRCMNISITG